MFSRLFNLLQRKQVARLKRKYVIIISIVVLILIFLIIVYSLDFGKNKDIKYGMTYSQKYAKELGLNWQDAFVNLIDDLGIKKFRLMAYWDDIELSAGKYDLTELDWLVRRAEYGNADIILVVGRRQPRWPECHQAPWVDELSRNDQMKAELDMIKEVVNHFKQYDNIIGWQVENEPFLSVFGECPETTDEFYIQKLELVRSLDDRPTIMTDSGELSTWRKSASLNPILGTSIYRYVWNKTYGDFIYPLPPAYYYLKTQLIKLLTPVKGVIVSEMQMEPWLGKPVIGTPLAEQYHSMNVKRLQKNFHYIQRAGLSPVYLWGVEWWYWLKEQGDESIWNLAKQWMAQ